jgi:uncharacterized peroxidase-related enzyme
MRRYGGFLPGVAQVLLPDLKVAVGSSWLYDHLHMSKSSRMTRLQREMLTTVVNGKIGGAPWLGLHTAAVRRLSGDESITPEFATTWPEYDLDAKTRTLLAYASKLTESPSFIDDEDIEALRSAGWDERGIYQATALISFFNMTGRMEAASGLPMDQVPNGVRIP